MPSINYSLLWGWYSKGATNWISKGFKVDEIDKIKEVNLPFISQVNKNGYMHFVVVYKINNNKILIMNPSTGKEVIDIFDFSNMWTGYILLLEKVSELPVY